MSSFALNFEAIWSVVCSICRRLLSIFCRILATGMLFKRPPSQLGNAEDRLHRFKPAATAEPLLLLLLLVTLAGAAATVTVPAPDAPPVVSTLPKFHRWILSKSNRLADDLHASGKTRSDSLIRRRLNGFSVF